jgi:hypothetical protein
MKCLPVSPHSFHNELFWEIGTQYLKVDLMMIMDIIELDFNRIYHYVYFLFIILTFKWIKNDKFWF